MSMVSMVSPAAATVRVPLFRVLVQWFQQLHLPALALQPLLPLPSPFRVLVQWFHQPHLPWHYNHRNDYEVRLGAFDNTVDLKLQTFKVGVGVGVGVCVWMGVGVGYGIWVCGCV